MSWLFSRALVEEYSGENSLGGEQSAPLSVMPTQHKFWRNDKTMECSSLSQFGLTCAVLTDDHGEELLKLCQADFLAKTYPSQEKDLDWTAKGLGYGEKWLGLLAKYDPDSRSLRTAQCSFLEDLMLSSVTLPASGLMLDGECYQLPQLARLIGENEFGYWPTPAASDATRGGVMTDKMTGQSLPQMVNTPHRWPTPTARIWKGGGSSMTRKNGKSRSDMLDWAVEYQTGGRLNPQWVEWLMGWPLGWTDLKPLATDKSHCAQPPLGES
jgi:hypothetical protein